MKYVSEKGHVGVLLAIILMIVGVGLVAGMGALNQSRGPNPEDYVAAEGECFVPPQGDPLYDEHYADINGKNCSAFKNQSEAFYTDEQTRALKWETNRENAGFGLAVGSLGGTLIAIGLLVLVILLRR